jgi:biotin transporter BioY
MKAILLTLSAIISLAIIYSLGWLSLWLVVSKHYQFADFTFAYFFAGTFASFVLVGVGAMGVMALCTFEDWREETFKR